MRNSITEMKNTFNGINKRLDEADYQVSDLEDRVVKTLTRNSKKKK